MADQQQHEAAPLGQADQLGGAGAYLGDCAGRGIQAVEIHGLDTVDHHHLGRGADIEAGDDVAQIGGRGQLHRRGHQVEAPGAQPHLVDRLFARDIDAGVFEGQGGGRLQQQRGFADAGIAADQNGGARDQPAAGDAVELGDAGDQAGRRGGGAFEADQLDLAAGFTGEPLGHAVGRGFLGDGVPGPAAFAFAGPARVDGTAFLADIAAGSFRHQPFNSIWIGPSARPWMNWST